MSVFDEPVFDEPVPEPALESLLEPEPEPPHDINNSAADISKIREIINSHLLCNNTDI